MALCKICNKKEGKYKLHNARHLTGQVACADCYQSFNEDDRQEYLFDAPVANEIDPNEPMSYNQFKAHVTKLEYSNIKAFANEIGVNGGTPATTWKKKDDIPFLVKSYISTKLKEKENPGKTAFVEITKEIPNHTFKVDSINYEKIVDIDKIVLKLKEIIQENELEIKDDYKLYYPNGNDSGYSLDNCYEKEIFILLQNIETLKNSQNKDTSEEDGNYINELSQTISDLKNQKENPLNSSIRFTKEEVSYFTLIAMNTYPEDYGKSEKDIKNLLSKIRRHIEESNLFIN
jgi:hypothetical protein